MLKRLASKNRVTWPSVILNRDLLIRNNLKFPPDFKHAGDWLMWIQCSSLGDWLHEQEALFQYRISAGQATTINNRRVETFKEMWAVGSVARAELDGEITKRLLKAKLYAWLWNAAQDLRLGKHFDTAQGVEDFLKGECDVLTRLVGRLIAFSTKLILKGMRLCK